MTDFQVGDRVSVEGVVTSLWPDAKPKPMCLVQVDRESYDIPADYWIQDQALTLVERPRRKLRVGSVWERRCADGNDACACGGKVDRYLWTGATFVSPIGDMYSRESRDIDTQQRLWREVPVDELEREAQ